MNWKEALRGHGCRLRYITRFSNCRRNHNESVAEHSYYVTYYAMLIAHQLTTTQLIAEHKLEQIIDWKTLYESCILHDFEEALTGDIPRTFKYSNQSLFDQLEVAAKEALQRVLQPLKLPQFLQQHITHTWKHAKNVDTCEGIIVKLADFVSVLSYMYQELEAGNLSIVEHQESILEYFTGFKAYPIIAPILSEIEPIVHELLKTKKV